MWKYNEPNPDEDMIGAASDGEIVPTAEEYVMRDANGSFAYAPALFTSVNDEASLFVVPYSKFGDKTAIEIVDSLPSKHRTKRIASIPAWRWRYMASWSNLYPFPDNTTIGDYHITDLQSPIQRLSTWLGWPVYDSSGDTLVNIGDQFFVAPL
ncbi:hypothetical protein BV22DRAFT_1049855 [Leucogyrophana mollusca]|uniref:Uncharacterized protein n=1 Tax=Leucogyrophana mollusca TaxID=85980 RepID=A0ACB8B863_9AGAM|nr:hypothetical protein BV22DRAFT_1049855 [Leucogyrophana mollusca]